MNKLIEELKKINTKYQFKDNKIIIHNEINNNCIEVLEDSNNEYIVIFSTQHAHFEDIDDVLDYINDIINEQVLPIEFYLDNKNVFGGDIPLDMFNNLTIKSLANYFGFSEDYISNLDYQITSWNGNYDVGRVPVSSISE